MWCRPLRHASTPALLPFMEEEALPTATPFLRDDGAQKPDWSKMMHLAPAQNPNVHGAVLDGETVLLNLITGRFFRLNPVGTAVWELCTGTATLQQIHQAVSARLELPPADLHEEMMIWVVQWSHDGLIHHVGGRTR